MNLRPTLVLLSMIMIIASCSGPQKLYEKGKYGRAFDKALSKAKKGKDRKMKTLLNKSFAKLIDQTRDDVVDIQGRYDLDDIERNLKKYSDVDERYDEGQAYLTDENLDKYEGLRAEKEVLVERVYDQGVEYMDQFVGSGRKELAREAYHHFILVDKYCSVDYENIDELLRDAIVGGTVVYNVSADLGFDIQYQWEVNRRFDDLEGNQNFRAIVYDGFSNQGDCLVELDFSSLDVNFQENNSTQNYSEEIQDGYTTKVDTSGREIKIPKYVTVTGSVTTRRITKTVSWRMELDVRSMNPDCDLREERFSRYVADEVEQYDIAGDERAIPSQFRSNNRQELESTDDMVDDLIDDLYRDVYNYLY